MFLASLASTLPLATVPLSPIDVQTPDPKALTGGLSSFAIGLLRVCDDAPGNVGLSPLSIARTLAMARIGAGGATAAELDRVLGTAGKDAAREFQALATALAPAERAQAGRPPAYELDLATAMFAAEGLGIQAGFGQGLKSRFGAEFTPLDFQKPASASETINAWASKHTRGRIPEIVRASDLKSNTRLVLTDAVYFSAAWNEAFAAGATRNERFTTRDGRVIETPTMHRSDGFGYGETEQAQVLEIACGSGATSLVVVLPKPGIDVVHLTDTEDFARWTGALKTVTVDVALPKFTIETGYSLREPLAKLGVKLLFDSEHCDLTLIAHEQLFVDAVLHRSRVAIDEAGVEAAAVTAMVIATKSALPPSASVVFMVDRPFLFALRHRATNAVLFCGRVDDPTRQ